MNLKFGESVCGEATKLSKDGKDANQVAKILCDRDNLGFNYGIGIVLNGKGCPKTTPPVLLEYIEAELKESKLGSYMNSAKLLEEAKTAVLQWQRIPQQYWNSFTLALPSDAGTGAVMSGIETALILDPSFATLGVEELGWPAYKAMAKTSRLNYQEFATGDLIKGAGVLPIYQAGPMNTTGLTHSLETIQSRANSANPYVILDRAYSGFEFAGMASESYDKAMRMSYENQIEPFIKAEVPFCLAVSPTKSFMTFALRPCGLLLIFNPNLNKQNITATVNTVIRARGSAFEHPITRAFIKAMIMDREDLEFEHQRVLKRLADAEIIWRKFVKGTAIEHLYSEDYAGLFRNTMAREDAERVIYNEHLYPVFSGGRCRLNIRVFAKHCY
jgi:hypothetical protein